MKTSKTSNPLGTYLKQFQEHLERQFYRPITIADYDRCLINRCVSVSSYCLSQNVGSEFHKAWTVPEV